jgi:hypothetical protein
VRRVEVREKQNQLDARLARPLARRKVVAVDGDQNAWLRAASLRDAVARFSAQDEKIDRIGGGAALSLQIAQCLTGTETHEAGRKLLQEMAPWGNNLLSRVLCFNSESLKAAHRAIEGAKPPAEPAPTSDSESRLADQLSNVLKLTAGRLALGDKALGFIEEASKNDAPTVLRRMAWAGHVFSLLSARAMYGINGLPALAMEARLVQTLALAGMSTMGGTVQKEVAQLRTDAAENAKRIALRAKKLQEAADPATRAGKAAALNRARSAAPGTRAAMLGGLFDMSSAIIKGNQFGTKLDARSGFDLLGQTLQGIGSLYDWRAKAYEETLYKGVKGTDLYMYKALSDELNAVNAAHLKELAFDCVQVSCAGGGAVCGFRWLRCLEILEAWQRCTVSRSSGQCRRNRVHYWWDCSRRPGSRHGYRCCHMECGRGHFGSPWRSARDRCGDLHTHAFRRPVGHLAARHSAEQGAQRQGAYSQRLAGDAADTDQCAERSAAHLRKPKCLFAKREPA